jgi:DNA-binding response OmpR family regulator
MAQGASVLIVDDEPAVCKAIRLILELEGYAVATAASGADAVQRVATEPPGVVLLDLGLPDADGREVQARLRELAPEVPVVFMTARHRAWQEAETHRAAGALPKPFDVDGVLETVGRFLPNPAP